MSSASESSVPPFEGPEKLLEIWFAQTAADVPPEPAVDGRTGLRTVERQVWEEMLDIVQCKVLSVVNGVEMDAYLLRCGDRSLIPALYTEYIQVNPPSSYLPTSLSSKHVEPR